MESTNRQTRPQNKETKTVSLFFTFVPCDPSANQRTMEVEKLFVVFVFFALRTLQVNYISIAASQSINSDVMPWLSIREQTHTRTHTRTHTHTSHGTEKKRILSRKKPMNVERVWRKRESRSDRNHCRTKNIRRVCVCVCGKCRVILKKY